MNTKDDQRQPKVGTSGLVCAERPEIIRCSTYLCGKPAAWRRPENFGGFHNGEWRRKCQTCFDRLGVHERTDQGWSRVLQPSHAEVSDR